MFKPVLMSGLCLLTVVCVFVCPASADLVARYNLNGNANDLSGNGNDGTINGAVATANRFGTANSALSFDGVNDFVDIQQLLFDGDDATVAFWARSAGSQNLFSVMVSQGHIGDTGFAFQYGFPVSNETYLIWGDNAGGGWSLSNFNFDLEQDTDWHHFAITKSGNTITNYLDGVVTDTTTSNLVFGTFNFVIGQDTFNGGRHFNGAIDDLYVFDRGLSGAEIQQIMSIPEPSTAVLLVAGMLAGFSYRRRR